jgi:hypothetical protein
MEFCDDKELGYLHSRTPFAEGEGLRLDGAYRLAHLPLVAPQHPSVIARRDGEGYEMGCHERIFSLVLPVPWDELCRSSGYRELESEIRAQNFARKIAWDIAERRADKLHMTICGKLGIGTPPELTSEQLRELSHLGPVEVELRGLFSGNVNLGRLYLPAYPERRDRKNLFRKVQQILGRPETDLYVVGLYNLIDDLDEAEARALSTLIENWWGKVILRFTTDSLWIMGAKDDLALDSALYQRVPLA